MGLGGLGASLGAGGGKDGDAGLGGDVWASVRGLCH
jgi:hypothetical protein